MLDGCLTYSLQDFQQTPTSQSGYGYIHKRKCEACSRLSTRRLWKNPNENKRRQSPHLNDMGKEHIENQCVPRHKQASSECHSFIPRS